MAIELLTKGKIKHLYRHDAESFIWVLTWVCLRYREGTLLNKARQLDRWLQVDAIKCRKEKSDFLIFGRHGIEPSPSHADRWIVARSSLRLVGLFYAGDAESSDSESELYPHSPTDTAVFETRSDLVTAVESSFRLRLVGLFHVDDPETSLTNAIVFETWLLKNICRRLSPKLLLGFMLVLANSV